jgi:hypothetical protein
MPKMTKQSIEILIFLIYQLLLCIFSGKFPEGKEFPEINFSFDDIFDNDKSFISFNFD